MTSVNNKSQEVFESIFGAEQAQLIRASLKELSPELARLGIDFPFGEFYAKDDLLDLKTREMITLSTLITQGTLPQLEIHMHAALNVGCTPVQIEQAILQMIIYVGMPKTINAMKVFKKVLDEKDIR